MAIYHLEIKTYGRNNSAHANAIMAAAYRAGAQMRNEITGRIHNYRRKSEVVHTEILAPRHAPEWIADRSRLWHEVEKAETYKNARLFREFVAALPHELTREQNIALVRDFVTSELTSIGMVADCAMHEKPGNHHVHISCPTREVSGSGFNKKNREWNHKNLVFRWRKAFAEIVNRHLAQADFSAETFIDHRTLAEQGIDRVPTTHVGRETPDTKEIHAQKVAHNRYVEKVNAAKALVANADQLDILRAEVVTLETQLAAAEQIIGSEPACESRARFISQEKNVHHQAPAPISLNSISSEDRDEFKARAAFIQALGKSAYKLEKFVSDATRMVGKPGGPRLRWWLYTFKEAQEKYGRSYGFALVHVPKDVSRWMGQCWNVLGETGTWSQFASAESARAARTKVAWPGDPPCPQPTIAANLEKVVALHLPAFAQESVQPTKENSTEISCSLKGLIALERKCGATEVHEYVVLYSAEPDMRFHELNVKSTVPHAERLYIERRLACERLGKKYTWRDFHQDVLNLHCANHPHNDMLDWWRDLRKEAKRNGVLDSEPSRTLFFRCIPRHVVTAYQRLKGEIALPAPNLRPELQSVVDGRTCASKLVSKFTRNPAPANSVPLNHDNVAQVTSGTRIESVYSWHNQANDYDIKPLEQPKHRPLEYPRADIPVWVIPTLEPK